MKGDTGGRGLNPPYGGCFIKLPEMVLFAAKRNFKISQLQNYMSHVNEIWSRYVPPQQNSFAEK